MNLNPALATDLDPHDTAAVRRQLSRHWLDVQLDTSNPSCPQLVGACACGDERRVKLTKHHPINALAIIEREHAQHLVLSLTRKG